MILNGAQRLLVRGALNLQTQTVQVFQHGRPRAFDVPVRDRKTDTNEVGDGVPDDSWQFDCYEPAFVGQRTQAR